jgi:hypothetical protein
MFLRFGCTIPAESTETKRYNLESAARVLPVDLSHGNTLLTPRVNLILQRSVRILGINWLPTMIGVASEACNISPLWLTPESVASGELHSSSVKKRIRGSARTYESRIGYRHRSGTPAPCEENKRALTVSYSARVSVEPLMLDDFIVIFTGPVNGVSVAVALEVT